MNISKFLILIAVLLQSLSLLAQDDDSLFHIDSFQKINFKANYDLSSYLNNSLLGHYFFSGDITQDIKDKNYNRLIAENNPIGNSIDIAFQYRNNSGELFGNSKLGYSVAMEWHSLYELAFTQDAFALLFYGNKMFVGKNANLNNMQVNSLNYYQIKAGLFHIDRDQQREYGFQLSLNLGNQFSKFGGNNAQLYTDSLGKYIDLSGTFSNAKSEYLGSNYSNIQGYGSGVDLYYQIGNIDKWQLRFDIQNFGFIHWNKLSSSYNQTEEIHFEGFEIDNIFNIPDPLTSTNLNDTLSSYLEANSTQEAQWTFTPMDVKLNYKYNFNQHWGLSARVQHRFFSLSKTYFEFGILFQVNKRLLVNANINYGAYAKYNIGIGLQAKINTKFVLEIQSRFLSGIMTKSFSGMGAFAQLNYKI